MYAVRHTQGRIHTVTQAEALGVAAPYSVSVFRIRIPYSVFRIRIPYPYPYFGRSSVFRIRIPYPYSAGTEYTCIRIVLMSLPSLYSTHAESA